MEEDEVARACSMEREVAWQCFDLNNERDQLKDVPINLRIILKMFLKETGWGGEGCILIGLRIGTTCRLM
jgi:hypothetical protein